MDRTVDNPNWVFRDLTEEDGDTGYGGVTKYVVEHKDKSVALRIGLSEGMYIMKCDRGKWQVDIGQQESDYSYGVQCFDNEVDAVDNAIGWVENL